VITHLNCLQRVALDIRAGTFWTEIREGQGAEAQPLARELSERQLLRRTPQQHPHYYTPALQQVSAVPGIRPPVARYRDNSARGAVDTTRDGKGQCQPPGCSPGQLRGDSLPPAHWAALEHRMPSRECYRDMPELLEALSGEYTDQTVADGEYQASQRWPDTMPPNVCTTRATAPITSGQALTVMPQPTLRTRSSACPLSPPP